MKKGGLLLLLGMLALNAAFGCDIKVNGKWYEDMPCCVAKLCKEGYKRCNKLSLEDFDKVNELRKEMSKLMVQLGASEEVEKRTSIVEEFNALDKELKDITSLSYGETFKKCTF